MREALTTLNRMADILATVEDKKAFPAAKAQAQPLRQKLAGLRNQIASLAADGQIADQDRQFGQQLWPEIEAAGQRLEAESERLKPLGIRIQVPGLPAEPLAHGEQPDRNDN